MKGKVIATEKAPQAIGPYSQGIEAGSLVCLSGQIAIDPATGELVPGDIRAQAEQVMQNIGAILEAAGLGYGDVVKTTCFLTDMKDFAAFNAVYGRYFTDKPARSCVGVASLPKGALAEVEVMAVCP